MSVEVKKLFPDQPPLQDGSGHPGSLYLFAAVHVGAGVYGLYRSIAERFDGAWVLAAPAALLLIASGLGLAFRRRRFDHAVARCLVFLFRVGGGLTLIVGAMAMREHMDSAWTVMGVSLAIALWGIAFGHFLTEHQGAFLLRTEPAARPDGPTPAIEQPAALAEHGHSALLVRLEQGVGQTAKGFRRGTFFVGGLFFAMALLYVQHLEIAAFIAAFGAVLILLGTIAVRRNAPERMAPVLAALRDAPDRIELIRHYTTSDSRRIFVTNWIEVKTDQHRLLVKANTDWDRVLEQLAQRCPHAEVKR